MSLVRIGKKLSEEHRSRISQGQIKYYKKVKAERRSQALKKFYEHNEVWNKGLSWSSEIREKIRQGCLNSSIGMGPKFKQEEEREEEQEVIA